MNSREFASMLGVSQSTVSRALNHSPRVPAEVGDLGVAVPDQAQILGADDVPLTEWIRPLLSAVHIPVPEMVRAGCSHLRELVEGKKRGFVARKFAPSLVLRDTTLPGQP